MTARVLRESFTRNGSRRRSLFMSAIVALWMATSLPAAPIAMPMSPAASAGRVVHAVADDCDLVAFRFHGADKFHLGLRQTITLGLLRNQSPPRHAWRRAGGRRKSSRCAARRLRFNSASDSLASASGLILQDQPSRCSLTVARDENQTPAFRLVQVNRLFEVICSRRCP